MPEPSPRLSTRVAAITESATGTKMSLDFPKQVPSEVAAMLKLMAQHGLVPGTKVHAQYWYRDPGLPAPNSIGLTNALAFDVLP